MRVRNGRFPKVGETRGLGFRVFRALGFRGLGFRGLGHLGYLRFVGFKGP